MSTEKREYRWRSKCPQKVQERLVRAKTQEFVVLEQKGPTKSKCSFVIAGETGNAYKVGIGKVPTCNCPDYKKRNDHCKHTLFVLHKIVGLDCDDKLMHQKAFLTGELMTIFECLEMNRGSASEYYFRNSDESVDELIDQFGTTTLEDGVPYKNVRIITGQKSIRDNSTYRPHHWELSPYRRYR